MLCESVFAKLSAVQGAGCMLNEKSNAVLGKSSSLESSGVHRELRAGPRPASEEKLLFDVD